MQVDGHYSPGCTVYLETWRRCNDVVYVLVKKEVNFYGFTVMVRISRVSRVRVNVRIRVRFSK